MTSLQVCALQRNRSSYVFEVSSGSLAVDPKIDLDVCLAFSSDVEYAKETIDCLGPDDTLTIFVFGGTNPKVLPRTSMDERGKTVALGALSSVVVPNDYCHLWDGLHACLRYAEIERPKIPGRLSVVVLVTSGRRTVAPLGGEREELRKYLYVPTRNPCKIVVAPVGPYAESRLLYDLAIAHDRFGNDFVDTIEGLCDAIRRSMRTCARDVRIDLIPRHEFHEDEVNAEGFPGDLLFGHQDLSRSIVLGDVFHDYPRRIIVRLPRGLCLDYMDVFLEFVDPVTGETKKAMGLSGPIEDAPDIVSLSEQRAGFFSALARANRIADQDVDFARTVLVGDIPQRVLEALSTKDEWDRWGRTYLLAFSKRVFWSM